MQFGGEEWKVADLSERAKAAYLAQGHRASGIKKLSVYVKPEEGKAYYVINGQGERQHRSVISRKAPQPHWRNVAKPAVHRLQALLFADAPFFPLPPACTSPRAPFFAILTI